MKKVLFFAVAMAAMVMASCSKGGDNTPRAVAEKSVECLKNKNYEGYVDLMLIDDKGKGAEEVKSTKQMYVGMMKSKYEDKVKKEGEMKSYSFISEDVKDSTATVKMLLNMEQKNDTMIVSLKKDKDGQWKIKQKK